MDIDKMGKQDPNITLSDAMIGRLSKILCDENNANALRICVEGGGCSGFSYKYDLVNNKTEDDWIIERRGAKVLIDSISLMYMQGCVIDFVDDLMGQSFQIKNPNAVASCGCGTSFSI